MSYVLALLGALFLGGVVLAVAVQIAWTFRHPFWRSRHHDHLIPPAPRSYRKAG